MIKRIIILFGIAASTQVAILSDCPKDSKLCKGKKAYVTGSIILRKGPINLKEGKIEGGMSGFLHFGDEVVIEEITAQRYSAMGRFTYGVKVRAANGTAGYVHELNYFENSEATFPLLHTGE